MALVAAITRFGNSPFVVMAAKSLGTPTLSALVAKLKAEPGKHNYGWGAVPAVQHGRLHEIKSCDILQPGPAALTDGLEQLHRHFAAWAATLS